MRLYGIVLAAGHLAKELFDTVGEKRNGLELIYAIEQAIGDWQAIKHGLEYIEKPDEPTIILNGDILLRLICQICSNISNQTAMA